MKVHEQLSINQNSIKEGFLSQLNKDYTWYQGHCSLACSARHSCHTLFLFRSRKYFVLTEKSPLLLRYANQDSDVRFVFCRLLRSKLILKLLLSPEGQG